MNIQFHNATNAPLILAYHDGSMVMVDNNGNTYIPAGGNPGQLQGMGIDRGNQTDSQFQLGPGQTGYALFSVARYRAPNSPVGTGYSYNLTIDELQLQNDALAIPVRTYNLNFPSLAAGTSTASFGSSGAPATGFVGNGNGGNSVGAVAPQGKSGIIGATAPQGAAVPHGNAQTLPGNTGFVGASLPRPAVQNMPVQHQVGTGVTAGAPIGVAGQQQGIINGGKGAASQTVPASPINNGAMKAAVPAAMKAPVNAPTRAQAAPVIAAKPNPATPAVKTATTSPQKNVAATTTTNK
jgi:hypothetical protein